MMPLDRAATWIYAMELQRQCEFALMAWSDLDAAMTMHLRNPLDSQNPLASTRIWYSLQAFLNACANLSKLLQPDALRRRGESVDQRNSRVERGQTLRT